MKKKFYFQRIASIKLLIGLSLIFQSVLLSACSEEPPPRSTYTISAEDLEARFGQIIEVANIPTPDQHGTGDKMGLFRDKNGTFWGVPVSVGGKPEFGWVCASRIGKSTGKRHLAVGYRKNCRSDK